MSTVDFSNFFPAAPPVEYKCELVDPETGERVDVTPRAYRDQGSGKDKTSLMRPSESV